MSTEDKTRFINNIKRKLSDVITANEMKKMIDALVEESNNFDINMIKAENYTQDDFLKAYIDALKIEGRSPKTLIRYEYIIKKMINKINIPTTNVTVYNVRSYLSSEQERGVSNRTLDGERQIFNGYFGWLQREGLIKSNPIANIGTIKTKKKVKDIFSDVDIEMIKKSCKNNRDKAIVMFLLSTGCRVSEAMELNRSNVDLSSLECKVIGKGNKERIVYLDEVAAMFLRNYLNERKDENEALFLNKFHKRMGTNGVRKIMTEIEKTSHVENIHPHKFRRTLATNLIKHGMPIEKVATILGHDKIDTTMEYVMLDASDIKYSYGKYTY